MAYPEPTWRPAASALSRRVGSTMRLACIAALAGQSLVSGLARAEDVSVPISLQAALLARVAAYDGNLASRAGDRVRVLIVRRPGDRDSERFAVQAQSALAAIPNIVGLAHDQTIVSFSTADNLAKLCREQHPTILYLMPGLSEHVEVIARALVNVDILSVTAVGSDARRGVVIGFDLVSGKTTLLINLRQARQQNVSLSSDVLRLATVIQ